MRLAILTLLFLTSLVLAGGHGGSSKGSSSNQGQGADQGKDSEDDPRYDHAVELKEHGKLQQAAEILRQITKDDPEDADAWFQLGVVEKELEDLREASYCLNRAVEADATMADAWTELGEVQLDQDKAADAIDSFQKAIKLDPNDASALAGLGNASLKKGNPADAEKNLKAALKLDPDMTDAYIGLGTLYLQQGKKPEALATLRTGFECESDHDAAVKAYSDAIEQIGSDRDKSFLAAWKAEKDEKFEEAGKALQALTKDDPNDFRAFAVLGDVYLNEEPAMPKEAIAAYQSSLTLEGKAKAADRFHTAAKAEVYEGLGHAYFETKEYDKAEQAYKSGQKLDPHNAYFPYHLACLAAVRSKAAVAMTELKNALEINPELVDEAREDSDFESLKSNAAFQQLLSEYGSSY